MTSLYLSVWEADAVVRFPKSIVYEIEYGGAKVQFYLYKGYRGENVLSEKEGNKNRNDKIFFEEKNNEECQILYYYDN